ncbi:MAG TPA: PHP domain-containing protein [Longimicrobiales bacterium]|nr:PHP domain-containing protein [Longimicrobiales bacterium]
MRIDMHVHTRGSFDCLNDPDAVIRRARDCGLDRICITDHNEIDVALMLQSAYPDFVIAGEEVKTAERVDIIGLFLRERIPKGTPARQTCLMIREQGGLVYVPHPFAGGKGGGGRILGDIADLVDAVEGFNARIHSAALNEKAVEWARARDLPVGAGSDAHTLQEIGRGWVEVPGAADTPPELLAGLRRGRTGGTLSSRLVHAASTWAKVRKGMGTA